MISRRGLVGFVAASASALVKVAPAAAAIGVRTPRGWTEEEALAEAAAREEAAKPGGELSMYNHQHYVFDEHGYLDSHWTEVEMAERRITCLHSQGRTECKLIVRFTHDGLGLTPEEL